LIQQTQQTKKASAYQALATTNMAEEAQIAQLKQLQAEMNAAFDSFFASTTQSPRVPREIATAKQQINRLAQNISGTILGPAFSLINLALQVCYRVTKGLGFDHELTITSQLHMQRYELRWI